MALPRARTPIEIMIDRACGIEDGVLPPPPRRAELKCPRCGLVSKHRVVVYEPDTMEGGFVSLPCPDCWRDGDEGEFAVEAGDRS